MLSSECRGRAAARRVARMAMRRLGGTEILELFKKTHGSQAWRGSEFTHIVAMFGHRLSEHSVPRVRPSPFGVPRDVKQSISEVLAIAQRKLDMASQGPGKG